MYKNTEKYLTKYRQIYWDVTINVCSYDKRFNISMNKFELTLIKQDTIQYNTHLLQVTIFQKITITNLLLVLSIVMVNKPSKNNRRYQTPQDLLKSN